VLAYNYFQTNDFVNGTKVMEQFMANAKPDDIIQNDYEYYARLLSKVGNDSLAIVNFQKATTPKNKAAMLREIQSSYEKMKRYDKVVELYEEQNNGKANVGAQTYLDWAKANTFAANMPQIDSLAKAGYMKKADSLFAIFTEKMPDSYLGYIYRARVNSFFDQESTQGLAKPYYEKVVAILEPKGERKKELIEAYQYLGYQYFLANDKENSKSYFNKILLLDPTNETAKKALAGIK